MYIKDHYITLFSEEKQYRQKQKCLIDKSLKCHKNLIRKFSIKISELITILTSFDAIQNTY